MAQKLIIPCLLSNGSARNLTISNSLAANSITPALINAAINPIIASQACFISSSSGGYISAIKGDPYVEVTTRTDIDMAS